MTITVREARTLRDLAAAGKTATSMGNQGTQSPQFRRGVELIREGAPGQIEEHAPPLEEFARQPSRLRQ